MGLFFRFLRDRRNALVAFAAFALVFAATFALYRLPLGAVLYPAALCLVLGIAWLFVDFARTRRLHRELEKLMEPDAVRPSDLPAVRGVAAGDYRELARLLLERRRDDETRAEAERRAMADYYTLWAHQIKTPIAAMRLRLQDEDSARARALLTDLGRIERYAEMVLTYQRLEGSGTDYVIRRVDLDGVLRSALKKFAGEFIGRRLKLVYAPVNASALTDEKWLGFVVEQVLSNALKYTPSGTISVYMEAPCTLCVRDTGIGIAPEDLPRVFEQSFTGLTGRADRRASGIGLYLCKRICDDLGHGIALRSAPGAGTEVRIDLSARKLDFD